jgi:hypothetical protein
MGPCCMITRGVDKIRPVGHEVDLGVTKHLRGLEKNRPTAPINDEHGLLNLNMGPAPVVQKKRPIK